LKIKVHFRFFKNNVYIPSFGKFMFLFKFFHHQNNKLIIKEYPKFFLCHLLFHSFLASRHCLLAASAHLRENFVGRLTLEYGPNSGHTIKSYSTLIQE